MKKTTHLFLALLCLLMVSCANMYSSETPTPYGVSKRQFYSQLGMKNGGIILPQGGGIDKADGEKSLGQAMTAAGAVAATGAWSGVEKAKSASAAATARDSTRAAAATEQARIKATESAAKALGANPEANVGAIDAVGRVLR